MNNIKYSKLFDREYDESNAVRLVNTKQSGLYIKHGIKPVDIFWEKETLVFVFSRADTKYVYDLWCKHELV